jgi:hypothetical protein
MGIGSVLSHSKFLKIGAVLMVGKNEKLSSVGSCTTALIIALLLSEHFSCDFCVTQGTDALS